ncbi:hypothetical protein ILUMI_06338 [Ignelater luminosus]|uniref:SEFIR domain-containing protein n=1 Tax=Ignelater luminosus TaxID=2038154 RepID=A0A8K0GHV1_IGNLU|nr:hypothetical protein ILUMI_06338 [Ignelater luminosus]
MKQILLMWCLTFGLDFVICSKCINYSEMLEQRACINGMNNTKCEWTDKIVSNNVQQQKDGDINVKLPMLASCNTSNHIIYFSVNRKITTKEKCSQDFVDNTKWHLHSQIKFEPYSVCSEEEKNDGPFIKFDYVLTGCYHIEIEDANEGMNVYTSDPFFISTDYKKQLLTDNTSITMLEPCVKGETLETVIRINTNETKKSPSIYISLGKGPEPILQGQIRTVYINEEAKTFNQTFEVCKSLPNVTFDCTSKKNLWNNTVYTCRYKGLHPGKYSFRYKLLDEYTRCNKDSLWAKPTVSCDGSLNITVTKINFTKPTVYEQPASFPTEFYVITAIIIVLAFLIICTVVYLYRRVSRNRSIQNTPILQYPLLNKSNETVQTDVSQEVLLIYTRESESFCKIISSFKKLFGQAGNISIYDINDYNEEIHVDPQDWIVEKISNSKTTVILFLNICGLMIYEKYPNITYKDEECQDKLFVFAIKQLRTATSRNDKNFFVIQLNNFPIEDPIFKSLPIEKRYIMPRDIQILLSKFLLYDQDLYENSLDKFKDSCSKHEELCEDSFRYINSVFINLH